MYRKKDASLKVCPAPCTEDKVLSKQISNLQSHKLALNTSLHCVWQHTHQSNYRDEYTKCMEVYE